MQGAQTWVLQTAGFFPTPPASTPLGRHSIELGTNRLRPCHSVRFPGPAAVAYEHGTTHPLHSTNAVAFRALPVLQVSSFLPLNLIQARTTLNLIQARTPFSATPSSMNPYVRHENKTNSWQGAVVPALFGRTHLSFHRLSCRWLSWAAASQCWR